MLDGAEGESGEDRSPRIFRKHAGWPHGRDTGIIVLKLSMHKILLSLQRAHWPKDSIIAAQKHSQEIQRKQMALVLMRYQEAEN